MGPTPATEVGPLCRSGRAPVPKEYGPRGREWRADEAGVVPAAVRVGHVPGEYTRASATRTAPIARVVCGRVRGAVGGSGVADG